MKLGKMLEKLNDILDDDRREQARDIDSLKDSLKRLKKKQKQYTQQCKELSDKKQKDKIQGKIDIVRAQRKKGLKLLKSLKKEREAKKNSD